MKYLLWRPLTPIEAPCFARSAQESRWGIPPGDALYIFLDVQTWRGVINPIRKLRLRGGAEARDSKSSRFGTRGSLRVKGPSEPVFISCFLGASGWEPQTALDRRQSMANPLPSNAGTQIRCVNWNSLDKVSCSKIQHITTLETKPGGSHTHRPDSLPMSYCASHKKKEYTVV